MQKPELDRVLEIVNAVSLDLASVVSTYRDFVGQDESLDLAEVGMYFDDIAHINRAVMQFAADRNIDTLESAIYEQDTFVRDFFESSLEVIDEVKESMMYADFEF